MCSSYKNSKSIYFCKSDTLWQERGTAVPGSTGTFSFQYRPLNSALELGLSEKNVLGILLEVFRVANQWHVDSLCI